MIPEERIQMDNLEQLVRQHLPFIIHVTSTTTGRYVSIEHDDAFSIALEAFSEAVERYEEERGSFLSFAGLVMESRLKTYLSKERREQTAVSLDEIMDSGMEPAAPEETSDSEDLQEEICLFKKELMWFGLSLEVLADESPRHSDTRKRAVEIGEQAGNEPSIVKEAYRKRKLPIRLVSRCCQASEKTVKGNKSFILAVMVVFAKHFTGMIYWIKGSRCAHVS